MEAAGLGMPRLRSSLLFSVCSMCFAERRILSGKHTLLTQGATGAAVLGIPGPSSIHRLAPPLGQKKMVCAEPRVGALRLRVSSCASSCLYIFPRTDFSVASVGVSYRISTMLRRQTVRNSLSVAASCCYVPCICLSPGRLCAYHAHRYVCLLQRYLSYLGV